MPATAVGSANGRSISDVDQPLAGEAVADQDPGDDQAEQGVDRGRGERRAEAHPEGGEHARRGERRPDLGPGARGLDDQGGQRDQHDQPEVGEGEAERQPEPGQDARLLQARRAHDARPTGVVDLVEHAAVGEVGFLRLLPAAEHLVDGDQVELGEALEVGRVGVLGPDRPVVVLGGQPLAGRRVEVLEVGLGDLAGAVLVGRVVDHGHRRLGQDAEPRARRSRTCPGRAPRSRGRPRSPRPAARRRCRAARRSWSSRARRSRAPARSCRARRRTSCALASSPPGWPSAKPQAAR